MLPHTSSVCLWLWRSCWRLPMFVNQEYMCMSVPVCIQDVHLYPWEYLCDSKMYICINPCVHLCAFLRYTCVCVCVQVYPNLCVWVYQRCVCVLVCLFIRNFFLVHWADFLSDLSDQMLSGFFVHLFLASYVF